MTTKVQGRLILSRKWLEKIMIGDNITLTVVGIDRDRVKLAFEAPRDVVIMRQELVKVGSQDASSGPAHGSPAPV